MTHGLQRRGRRDGGKEEGRESREPRSRTIGKLIAARPGVLEYRYHYRRKSLLEKWSNMAWGTGEIECWRNAAHKLLKECEYSYEVPGIKDMEFGGK